jgi:PIN domain nuclease of toxin-antitoxin system
MAPERLSPAAVSALDAAQASGKVIYLSSVSIVEVIYLIEKGRLGSLVLGRLIDELSDPESGLILVPVDLAVAQAVRRIPRASIPDMPDRIIAATALHLGVPLVTRDQRIRTSGVQTVW